MSKITFKKHVDLLLLEENDKQYYVLINKFDTFMYDHNLDRRRNLQAFSTEEILKCYINDCFKVRGKQMI